MTSQNLQKSSRLTQMMKRGTDFLDSEVAIMGGAMSWVSEHNLVAALSNSGAFGVLAAGAMSPDLLLKEIQATKKLTTKPFAVNIVTMHPQLEQMIQTCVDEKVSHIVLAGGIPTAGAIKQVKDSGAKLIAFTPAVALGKRLVRMGVDALVIEGMEAGGHIGPVSTSVLAQEILPEITDVPVFVAGGIARGEAMLTYLEMGAAGVQLGTRFVCATECIAHENFKNAFIHASSRDAIPSIQLDPRFPIIPVRAISNEGTRKYLDKQRDVILRYERGEVTKEAGQLEIEHYWAGALRRAVIDGDIETGSVMAGQSVGLVKKVQPTQEILQDLLDQAEEALKTRV